MMRSLSEIFGVAAWLWCSAASVQPKLDFPALGRLQLCCVMRVCTAMLLLLMDEAED